MRVFHKLEEVKKIKKPIVTIGTFDGVHLGHQKIIKKIIKEAKKVDGESVLLTFYPHPRMVLYPKNHGLQLLQTQKEKLNSLKETGIDNVVILPFSMEFSRIPAWDFVRDILVNSIGVHTLVIGYDHQFGKNREGNINYLHDVSNSFNFKVIEISAEEVNDVNISSTKIRNALFDGNVEIPKNYLGRPFLISGEVVKGDGIGSKIGFPTANISIKDDTKLIPQKGVYGVLTRQKNKEFYGIMNIGTRPSIQTKKTEQRIEVYLFDFNEDIYGEWMEIKLLKRIRNENKFDSLEALKKQIIKDEITMRNFLGIDY